MLFFSRFIKNNSDNMLILTESRGVASFISVLSISFCCRLFSSDYYKTVCLEKMRRGICLCLSYDMLPIQKCYAMIISCITLSAVQLSDYFHTTQHFLENDVENMSIYDIYIGYKIMKVRMAVCNI